jgi:hypothetical protein
MNPKYIIAVREIAYDVDKIIKDLQDVAIDDSPITMEDVMLAVQTWSVDDLSCGYGHTIDLGDLDFREYWE